MIFLRGEVVKGGCVKKRRNEVVSLKSGVINLI